MNGFEGYIVRTGDHWGKPSLEWAKRRLAYRGTPRVAYATPHADVLVFGEPETVTTLEGVHLFATEFEPVEGLPLSEAYREGAWREGAAQIWSTSMLLAIDPRNKRIDILIGEFCEGSRYYARTENSFFFAPEIKAFSNLGSLRDLVEIPAATRLVISCDRGKLEFENLESEWPASPPTLNYAEAVARCRELMERNLDEALARIEKPFAVSFSGGIDSSILVYMLARRRIPIHAFFVWFDEGSGELPADLAFARKVAGDLDFKLNEIRVNQAQLARYLPMSLFYGERSMTIEIESAIYYLPLLEALRDQGFRAKMSGDGCDAYFAGYHRPIDPTDPVEFREEYLKILRLGWASHIGSFHDLYSIELCEPFASIELLHFGLNLPREYLMKIEDGQYVGKRIVRDAYRGEVPDEILDRRKGVPSRVNGTTEMMGRLFPESASRTRSLRSMRRTLLRPPDLRYVPAWVVRAGWLDAWKDRRLK